MANLIMGIDPGKFGAISIVDFGGPIPRLVHTCPIPLVQYARNPPRVCGDSIEELVKWEEWAQIDKIVLEKIWGRSIKLAINFGQILGILNIIGVPFELVAPRTWQSKIIPKTPKGQTKTASISYARRHHGVTLKDGPADAICMAHWGNL